MKTPEQFYKETAKELGIDLETVTAANKYFWRYGVEEEIRKGQQLSIYIGEIGTLYASMRSVNLLIRKHIAIIRGFQKKELTPKNIERTERSRESLRDMWKLKQKIIKQKQKVKNERDTRVHKTYPNSSTECR